MHKIIGMAVLCVCLVPCLAQGAGLTDEQAAAVKEKTEAAQAQQQKNTKTNLTKEQEKLEKQIRSALPSWAPDAVRNFAFWELYLEPVVKRSGYKYGDFEVGYFDDKENPDRKGILNFYIPGEGPDFKTRYRIQFELHNLGRSTPGVIPLKYGPADGPAI